MGSCPTWTHEGLKFARRTFLCFESFHIEDENVQLLKQVMWWSLHSLCPNFFHLLSSEQCVALFALGGCRPAVRPTPRGWTGEHGWVLRKIDEGTLMNIFYWLREIAVEISSSYETTINIFSAISLVRWIAKDKKYMLFLIYWFFVKLSRWNLNRLRQNLSWHRTLNSMGLKLDSKICRIGLGHGPTTSRVKFQASSYGSIDAWDSSVISNYTSFFLKARVEPGSSPAEIGLQPDSLIFIGPGQADPNPTPTAYIFLDFPENLKFIFGNCDYYRQFFK